VAAPLEWDTRELLGASFACLEGCGFCCTFPPEVAHDELARLRTRFPRLPVARQDGGGLRLALQGGCGGCTLLARRRCTAYEERPRHCRYFPFHLYFGRRTEVYVNRTCRGVEAGQAAGDLSGAFAAQVLGVARPHEWQEAERQARRVHARFRQEAEAAGAWGDVDAATRRILADPGAAQASWSQPAAAADAWAPFAEEEVLARPFHLTADLRWLTFAADGDQLQVLEMQETGELAPGARLALAPNQAGDDALVLPELRRLAGRDLWAGTVFDVVDAAGYAVGVEAAAAVRVAAQGADLRLRLRVLRALGLPVDAAELARFADSAALDTPTIGGWL
jgi:Fe-S-cluster containining protein